jgi:outer membrane scaffolding protein for murein synthesis (MipA/OmpV family)
MKAACLLAAGLLASLHAAAASEEPLWEAGLGIAAFDFPDYRGSKESRGYLLPAPYFVYRGDFLKADRSGVRGSFIRNDAIDVNLSLGASLPVRDNPAREGMPDLKPSVEAGPSLEINIWRSRTREAKLDLRLPVRLAMSVESHPRFIGGQVYPHANVDIHSPAGFTGWNLGLQGGPVFTDRRYNRYFYSVAPEFATPGRPAYVAGGGYGGMQLLAAISKRFPKYWIGAFARYDSLRGATFEASPLVTSKHYAAGGIAISWILGESRERVPVDAFGQR